MESKKLQKPTSECSYEMIMIFHIDFFIKIHSCENKKNKKYRI